MKAVGISQFRAHTVEILEQISRAQENIIITKRGKPLARIIPYHDMDLRALGNFIFTDNAAVIHYSRDIP